MTMIITSNNTKPIPTNHPYLVTTTIHHQQPTVTRNHQVALVSSSPNHASNNHADVCHQHSNNHTITSNSPPSPSLLASRGVSLSPVNFPSYVPHPSNINNLLLFSKKSLLQHHYLQQQAMTSRNFTASDLGMEKFDRKINGNHPTKSTVPASNSPMKLQIGSSQGKTMGVISASEKCFSHKNHQPTLTLPTYNTSSSSSRDAPYSNKIESGTSRCSFDQKIDSILSSIDEETERESSTHTDTKKKSLSSIIFEEIASETSSNDRKRKYNQTTSPSASSSFQKVLDPPKNKKKKTIDEITAENMYENLLNKCRKNYIPQLQSINAITVAEEVTESGESKTTSCAVVPIISNEHLNMVVGQQLCSRAGPLTHQDKSIIRFIETNPINDFLLEFLENKKFSDF